MRVRVCSGAFVWNQEASDDSVKQYSWRSIFQSTTNTFGLDLG